MQGLDNGSRKHYIQFMDTATTHRHPAATTRLVLIVALAITLLLGPAAQPTTRHQARSSATTTERI